jgi:crotonobetainyl-CoA:carnitine CoA-transferase CaiB-like acyl-CoA transferase
MLTRADIPNAKVYTAADCAADPQYRHRNMVREVPDPNFGTVLQAGILPHFPDCPGTIRWAGPDIGQHTHEILSELLGLGTGDIAELRREGVI